MRRTVSTTSELGQGGAADEAALLESSAKSSAQAGRKRKRSEEPLPVRIRRAAMDALARREHSLAELKRKLQQKFSEQLESSSPGRGTGSTVTPAGGYPSRSNAVATGTWVVDSEQSVELSSGPGPKRTEVLEPDLPSYPNSSDCSGSSDSSTASKTYDSSVQRAQAKPISAADLSELIAEQLLRLRDEGLQSDARFTESFVRYRKTRGFAYQHIRADLQGRGVGGELIEEFLFIDDPDWVSMAEALVAKKLLGNSDRQFGGKTHRKLVRFLESRGFPSAVIRAALEPQFSQRSHTI